MFIVRSCLLVGVLSLLVACAHDRRQTPPFAGKAWQVSSLTDEGIANAIVRQQALFPYHFVEGSAMLNELGRHDLEVLARHYREAGQGGQISLRQGEANRRLYEARRRAITAHLAQQGVAANTVRIIDAPPGGPGMPAEQAKNRLHAAEERSVRRQAPKIEPLSFKISGNNK